MSEFDLGYAWDGILDLRCEKSTALKFWSSLGDVFKPKMYINFAANYSSLVCKWLFSLITSVPQTPVIQSLTTLPFPFTQFLTLSANCQRV